LAKKPRLDSILRSDLEELSKDVFLEAIPRGEPFSMGCLLFSDAHMLSCRPANAKAGRDDNEKKL
jgi:hypothetical protein